VLYICRFVIGNHKGVLKYPCNHDYLLVPMRSSSSTVFYLAFSQPRHLSCPDPHMAFSGGRSMLLLKLFDSEGPKSVTSCATSMY
jgi:hypothetical protein